MNARLLQVSEAVIPWIGHNDARVRSAARAANDALWGAVAGLPGGAMNDRRKYARGPWDGRWHRVAQLFPRGTWPYRVLRRTGDLWWYYTKGRRAA